jgi:hypothetical protein
MAVHVSPSKSKQATVPNSSTDQAGGKRRGDFIAVTVVNNKPQISADDFSILQFIGSNLVFAATVPASKYCHSRKTHRGRSIEAASFLSASRANIADANGDAPENIPRTPAQSRSLAQSKSDVETNFETRGMAPGLLGSSYLFAFAKLNKL